MSHYNYGYQSIDGQLRLGASGPRGLFVPQVSEMQPRGHWVESDGSLTAEHRPPGVAALFWQGRKGRRYVSYAAKAREHEYLDIAVPQPADN